MAYATIEEAHRGLTRWLAEDALPTWWSRGADLEHGGFFEKLRHDGTPTDDPRRTRVVARQIYVFAQAKRFGWFAEADAALDHGLRFFESRCLTPEGLVYSQVRPDGTVVKADFDLYDHAFALFGLAEAARVRSDADHWIAIGRRLREAMVAGWSHPDAGFEESRPRTLPLKANPHMHLFEAFLSFAEADPDGGWMDMAEAVASLAMARFIRPNGALTEFFDGDWQPSPGTEGRIVEPGHQFEWAWLLMRYAALGGRLDVLGAARRLAEIGEDRGVDPSRGVAFNELLDDLSLKDAQARLWPQTERIKAHVAAAARAPDTAARDAAEARVAAAASGLSRYFGTPLPGLFFDKMQPDGRFVDEPAPTSSLYHIVCAIAELEIYMAARRGRTG